MARPAGVADLEGDGPLDAALRLSAGIDRLNTWVGKAAAVLVLLAVLVSAGNAFSRYLFSVSSNAWLEIQWYMFSAMFLLGCSLHAAAERACPGRPALRLPQRS